MLFNDNSIYSAIKLMTYILQVISKERFLDFIILIDILKFIRTKSKVVKLLGTNLRINFFKIKSKYLHD